MAEIIQEVRRLANAGTADSVVGTVTYWTDNQIQDVIDRHVREFRRMALSPLTTYIDGATTYTDYQIPIKKDDYRIEREGAGGGFALLTSSGETAPSYTVSWSRGMVNFTANTGGDAFYLDCRAYNIWSAVADIFEAKAGMVSGRVDWSSDNHDIKASQEYQHYMDMAKKYRLMAGNVVGMSRKVRTDERY
jgi:hypothetical protein